MLQIGDVDLEELVQALSDQDTYDLRRLIDPATGEIVLWTSDGGIDGENPVDFDDLEPELTAIDPLPAHIWYRDMADFSGLVSDERTARRLSRALDGRGAFRRFRNELYDEYQYLVPVWNEFRDVRAARRAVDWLLGNNLVEEAAATRFRAEHPDPVVP